MSKCAITFKMQRLNFQSCYIDQNFDTFESFDIFKSVTRIAIKQIVLMSKVTSTDVLSYFVSIDVDRSEIEFLYI